MDKTIKIRIVIGGILEKYPALDGFFRRTIWSRIRFPEMELRFLNSLPNDSFDVAIDVGAALGYYSWVLNRKAKKVYAFEPGEKHGRFLKARVGGTNVELVRAAVGNATKLVNMYTAGSDAYSLHTATVSKNNPITSQSGVTARQVEQVTLDGFFEGTLGNDQTVDFLKVDVEGYETEVFMGAQALLRRYHPLVICEIEARHNSEYKRAFQILRSLGYVCYLFRDGRFQLFEDEAIEHLQTEEALKLRLSDRSDPATSKYFNNFVFQHSQSRVKVAN